MVNLGEGHVFLPKGQVVGYLDPECIDISEIELDIATIAVNAIDSPATIKEKVSNKPQCDMPSDFITSPADVTGPRKANLQDFKVTEEETKAFRKLCEKYSDVFSENSGDIGRTSLIKMDIDTRENAPVCHRLYTLPLKNAEWVKKELNILEAAGIIVRSVSSWASPIVVVPKRSAPGEAPAYFQRLIIEVLAPFDFAFEYLDDILIYSPDVEIYLKHLELIFQRLHEVDLKLKMEKCIFLEKHIQYLGHIISGDGIKPVPEKLSSIQQMPHPYTPKEVKQFLGLVGYYRKFIPEYADIARPLNALTRKDTEFVWTDVCQKSFDLLKLMISKEPILVYPDPSKPYVLFTGTSKYAWSCILTQEYTHEIDGKTVKTLHPISYQSGLFKGSQLNWACLTEEAYAIYMSIKKLDYYLVDVDIILRSDHTSP